MQASTAKTLLSRFLAYTETDVLGAFASLARAQKGSEFVYIPGTRKDRILLVAHADTVNDSKYSPKFRWMGDVVTLESYWRPPNKKVYDPAVAAAWTYSHYSLGADDRAGCAMLWALQNMGHSLLITTGEESGCKGAHTAVKEIKGDLARHHYALEVDRRGDRQAVFYDVGTAAFEEHMVKLLSDNDPEGVEWQQELGSSTDIRVICPEVRICGVNVSAGYFHEHSDSEHLYLEAWLHTHATLAKALRKEQQAFVLPKKAVVSSPPTALWKWCAIHGGWQDKCPPGGGEYCTRAISEKTKATDSAKKGQHTGPFKLQVFRVGGTKVGEGRVELRVAGVDGTRVEVTKISKRQCKKFGKYVQGLISRGGLDQTEAASVLAQAIRLRDGPVTTPVTQAQREEHAAGGVAAYLGYGALPKNNYNRGGEFVHITDNGASTNIGRCWHQCGGCKQQWYHERAEAAEDRPSFFCYCPICSPEVVPRLIRISEYQAAVWGYGDPKNPKPQTPIRVPVTDGEKSMLHSGSLPKTGGPSLNEPTVCQHYCARCQAPWRHAKPPVSRAGVMCTVGAYDHDCPLHSSEAAKCVIQYESALRLKGGWTQTLHKPPALDGDPHGAAPPERKDQLPLGGLGTGHVEVSGGGGVSN